MEHAIALGHESVDQRRIHDVAFDEPKPGAVAEAGQVIQTTGAQVVEGPYLMTSPEAFLREMGPDEAGTSCDQDPHFFPSGG
jgi:hypothetical protein